MNYLQKAATVWASTTVAMYLLWSFVIWDASWITEMGGWTPPGRLMFIIMMGLVPCWLGSYPIIFRK